MLPTYSASRRARQSWPSSSLPRWLAVLAPQARFFFPVQPSSCCSSDSRILSCGWGCCQSWCAGPLSCLFSNRGNEGHHQACQFKDRPMFRFSIRDVLWLTVVVGLAIGWWIDRQQISARLRDVTEELASLNLKIGLRRAWEGVPHGIEIVPSTSEPPPPNSN